MNPCGHAAPGQDRGEVREHDPQWEAWWMRNSEKASDHDQFAAVHQRHRRSESPTVKNERDGGNTAPAQNSNPRDESVREESTAEGMLVNYRCLFFECREPSLIAQTWRCNPCRARVK